MKVVIAAALLWILARHEFGAYLRFATVQAPVASDHSKVVTP